MSHDASIGSNVEIGPYSIVDGNVVVGENCWIGNHVTLKHGTRIGTRCKIFHGAVIGEIPQDVKFKGEETVVEIGDEVIIRELVTVNRGSKLRAKTEIRDRAYLMAYVHVAHDCFVGENAIFVNNVQLGGHVSVDDWVMIGGRVNVHQFCRIGKHAFIAGGYRVVQDVPPYVLVGGEPLKFYGLNSVGLRRQGFSQEIRKDIKRAYQLIYRSSLNTSQAIEEIKKTLSQSEEIQEIISFVESSKRGLT